VATITAERLFSSSASIYCVKHCSRPVVEDIRTTVSAVAAAAAVSDETCLQQHQLPKI